MYFPTSSARRLCTIPPLPNIPPEPVLSLTCSPRRSLFCTLTRNGITVWRVRPSAILGHLSRTPTSLVEHGQNSSLSWAPDGTKIIVQTSESYLVLVVVEYQANEPAYRSPFLPNSQRNFLPGAGEGFPLQSVRLRFEGVIRVEGHLLSVSPRTNYILFSTKDPPAVQRIPWPTGKPSEKEENTKEDEWNGYDTWLITDEELPWILDSNVTVSKILHSRNTGVETWITSDGRAYFVQLQEISHSIASTSDLGLAEDGQKEIVDDSGPGPLSDSFPSQYHHSWQGTCIHDFEIPKWVQKQRQVDPGNVQEQNVYNDPRMAKEVALNVKFSLIAIGTLSGSVEVVNFPSQRGVVPKSQQLQIPDSHSRKGDSVTTMEWSSDGYVLAVGRISGWAIFSVGGRCLAWGPGLGDSVDETRFQDSFMYGALKLFWAPGNFELFILANPSPKMVDGELFVIPFAKSATTGQHSPDNTRYAFLQTDDRALVYRGADQPDMSVINPESDVWQHIKIPQGYLATNWPIRYSTLSSDGRLIAVAGRRGLIHYSASSGRWKMFADEMQEQAFVVKGGLLWFHHVLIAAVEVAKSYQIRLYSRDLDLSNQNVLHREVMTSPVIILSLVDNSLLVYTADNTLHHYLIVITADAIKLHLCGSITFEGIIAAPNTVRLLSWMIPSAQKQFGDPAGDLAVATVLMMVGGRLVLLRPRKSGNQEVKYDLQIFADRIEFCWIHLHGIGTLENSLWGYDGQGIRVWLNALAIERSSEDQMHISESTKESLNIPLDFYPLSVLMDKGIIIGAEHEAATRTNLPFVLFRHATSSHLFLHHILRFQLETGLIKESVDFAAHYQHLVFFAHALEILLHTVVESGATLESDDSTDDSETSEDGLLPSVVQFLDHFDAALDVVVGCARKTEMTRWRRLFNIVGNPKTLFEICLTTQRLKTAGSYLLVLHNLEQLDENNNDAVRLLKSAVSAKDWRLCRELLRFLHSIDETGSMLRNALVQAHIDDSEQMSDVAELSS